MITYTILTFAAVYSIFLIYKMIQSISLQPSVSATSNNKPFIRVVLSGLFGFVAMFAAEWLYLNLSGTIKYLWNPYAGPPAILTCLAAGFFGAIFGALIGLFNYAALPRNRRRDIYISASLFLMMIIFSGNLPLALLSAIGYHIISLLLEHLIASRKKEA
ncbi:MAG: hypothetical protein A2X58_11805 [Nitrospirae bacterium GWC2_56_14]|nr:MAG: hypothetical protein A2X58_11805 [Nitrospirae bacterium GWC2_56_14]